MLAFLPVLIAGALWLTLSGDLHEGALLPWLVAGQCCARVVGSERPLDAMGWRQSLVVAVMLCALLALPGRTLAPVWVEVLTGIPSTVARTERVDGVGIESVQRPEPCPSPTCAPVVPRLRLREEGRVEVGFVGE